MLSQPPEVLVLAAVLIGLGLIYVSLSVPASVLSEAPPHAAKVSR